MRAVDLFAGCGGWDVAAQELGIDTLGIEWNRAACASRKLAGLPTLEADLERLEPGPFVVPCARAHSVAAVPGLLAGIRHALRPGPAAAAGSWTPRPSGCASSAPSGSRANR